MKYLKVFLAMTLLDGLWAAYVTATADDGIIAASLLAAAIILTTGYITVAYVNDRRMLWAAAPGAAFGTFLAMWLM